MIFQLGSMISGWPTYADGEREQEEGILVIHDPVAVLNSTFSLLYSLHSRALSSVQWPRLQFAEN
jgi:hypothetical protein